MDRRKTTSTRITPETRARLEEAAAQSGRSMAQEIELRLEQSFIEDFGSEQTRTLMRALALAKEMAEMATGKTALKDRKTAEAARTAMVAILNAVLPIGATAKRDRIEPREGQELVVSNPQARGLGDNIRDAILEGLGPNLAAIRSNLKQKQ